MVGTLVGATIFLSFLLLAVQFLVHLYAVSVLTSVTFDAAQQVATAPGDPLAAVAAAQARAEAQLGGLRGTDAVFEWREVDARQVELEVQAESPAFVPLPASYRRITRTVTVRTERFR